MEPSTLLDHVGELFYAMTLYPSLASTNMVGRVIVDEFDQKWMIESEDMWNNLNVSPSDQEKEGFPCRITGAVDVIKSRVQIRERRQPKPSYHGNLVGDKLSGLHIDSMMKANGCDGICTDAFDMIMRHGTTTRTEYNVRKAHALNNDVAWSHTASNQLNIAGSTYHTISGYEAINGTERGSEARLTRYLRDGPFYGSFHFRSSSLNQLTKENGLSSHLPNEPRLEANHGMMVCGFGSCSLLEEPLIKQRYSVARNSWGSDYPLIVRVAVECLDVGVVPFV